jgi:hypothetical protein
MHISILSLSSFIAASWAAPTVDSVIRSCYPTQSTKVARYDDLPFVEPGPNPIPSPYLGLSYTLFQVDQYDGFIPPTSGNQWTMAFGGSGNFSIPTTCVPCSPSHTHTDLPYSSSKQTFDLQSFSFACVQGIPQPECPINIWGFKSSGRTVKRTITFPRLDPGHYVEDFKMNKTTFGSDWTGLKSVGFSTGNVYGGLALDDVQYTIRTAC